MRFVLALVAAAFCSLPTMAQAQMSGRPYDWSGFYVGGHGALFRAGTTYDNPTTPTQTFAGAMLGGQIGYNLQFNRVVVGAEADMSFGNLTDNVRDGNFLSYNGKIDQMGTVRARIGYDLNGFLPFFTIGMMWDRMEQGSSCPTAAPFGVCAFTGAYNVASTQTFKALTLGGGAEYAISRHWSIKADILFTRFDKQDYSATIPKVGVVTAPAGQDLNSVARLGINYRF
jgi:outer membrane immunogenic protein